MGPTCLRHSRSPTSRPQQGPAQAVQPDAVDREPAGRWRRGGGSVRQHHLHGHTGDPRQPGDPLVPVRRQRPGRHRGRPGQAPPARGCLPQSPAVVRCRARLGQV
eukprot:scaffold430080_cov43-Prasinocladus_malaysianus.AAC.1